MLEGQTAAHPELTERQQIVLRALVAAYVGAASPVGSATISHLLSVKLSSASVRNTLSELSELRLIQKPHASAGRVPTDEGLRFFVERLLEPSDVEVYERRSLDRSFDDVDADAAVQLASQMLSEHTRQLGFVVAPRIERLRLQQVSFVRLSSERLLAVLVDTSGTAHQRAIESTGGWDQRELDRMAEALNERVVGRTLREARDRLRRDVRALRSRASRLIERALKLGLQATEAALEAPTTGELVITTRVTLLEQPEFNDPERLRELFSALEQGERLVDLLGDLLDGDEVSVALGDRFAPEGLSGCALVGTSYGDSVGVLGVIGPTRMDYARIIPLVGYCSQLVTEKLSS